MVRGGVIYTCDKLFAESLKEPSQDLTENYKFWKNLTDCTAAIIVTSICLGHAHLAHLLCCYLTIIITAKMIIDRESIVMNWNQVWRNRI